MMDFGPEHAETLAQILRWRRDVRHFRTDPVSAPLVARLRAAMALAPSVGNCRPWRVIQVDDPALRGALRDCFVASNAAAAAGYDDATREEYLRLKLAGLDEAPLHLAVFTVTDPAEGRRLGRRTLPETLTQSTAMAIHGLWLMARALNLGMGMVSILDPRAVERIFEVPGDWRFAAYLCVGWPAFHDDKPLLHRAGWQENTALDWKVR